VNGTAKAKKWGCASLAHIKKKRVSLLRLLLDSRASSYMEGKDYVVEV
jgi:hypothetical protein